MSAVPAIAAQPKGEDWHSQSAEEVLAKLGSAATGLSAQEAAKRLAADGPNELKEGKRISPFKIFLGQFKSLIIWILIAAGVISGVLGEVGGSGQGDRSLIRREVAPSKHARPRRGRWGLGAADRRSSDRRLRSGTPPASGPADPGWGSSRRSGEAEFRRGELRRWRGLGGSPDAPRQGG